jgi:linoleoyl-CoA desaturase
MSVLPPLPALPTLRYSSAKDSGFAAALREQSQQYVSQTADHRYADLALWLKAALLASLTVTTYLFALHAQTPLGFIMPYTAFFFCTMLLAMNVFHDAAHHALCKSVTANAVLMRVVGIAIGIDPDSWQIRHVHYHHTYANVEHYDLDIEANAFLRQTPFQQWHPQYRYQHCYWPLIAAVSLPYLVWYADFADRFGATPLVTKPQIATWPARILFMLAKFTHLMLVLVIPALYLHGHGIGIGTVCAAYLGALMLVSCLLVAMILGTHWADADFFLPPENGKFAHTWYEHAFHTACDWLPRPRWLAYWLGGLNFHLTHHLFPTVSHRHYPCLAPMVEQLAQEYGLRYRSLQYAQLWRMQQKFLREMGSEPTQPSVVLDQSVARS